LKNKAFNLAVNYSFYLIEPEIADDAIEDTPGDLDLAA